MDATQTNTKSQRRLGRGLSGLVRGPVDVAPASRAPGEMGADSGLHGSPTPSSASVVPSAPPQAPVEAGGAPDQRGGKRLLEVNVTDVTPNPFQPRSALGDDGLAPLAASIRASGVVQPITVRPRRAAPGGANAGAGQGVQPAPAYEIVAGERRWRAAMLAGLTSVPAVVADIDDRASAEWALVENVQREDLNPMDCAHALRALHDRFGLTQAQVAERVGMDRSSVANLVRFVELEAPVQDLVRRGALSAGHAKVLLSSAPGARRESLARRCADGGWSVRRLEALVKAPGQFADPLAGASPLASGAKELTRSQAAAKGLERRLADHLGTRVHLKTDATGKRGRIVIEFFDLDQLEGVLRRLGVEGE